MTIISPFLDYKGHCDNSLDYTLLIDFGDRYAVRNRIEFVLGIIARSLYDIQKIEQSLAWQYQVKKRSINVKQNYCKLAYYCILQNTRQTYS